MADGRHSETPNHPQIALRSKQAAVALGISERHLWQLTKEGHIPCARLGTGSRQIKLYLPGELQAWLKNASRRSGRETPLGRRLGNGRDKYFAPEK
jgi:excisionase family DNA binding protein